jgi:hypothetical protein
MHTPKGGTMLRYCVIKWSPILPARRMPAVTEVFTDLAIAEQVKDGLAKALPYRCFAVEPIKEGEDEQHIQDWDALRS